MNREPHASILLLRFVPETCKIPHWVRYLTYFARGLKPEIHSLYFCALCIVYECHPLFTFPSNKWLRQSSEFCFKWLRNLMIFSDSSITSSFFDSPAILYKTDTFLISELLLLKKLGNIKNFNLVTTDRYFWNQKVLNFVLKGPLYA